MEIIVANLCVKCGTELSGNEQSCPFCGAADTAQHNAAPVKSGRSALKTILIVVAVIVGLGIAGLGAIGFIGYRIAKNTHVDPNGRITMSTPVGTIVSTPMENIGASDLGVDIYPGAQSEKGGMKMEMPNATGVTGVFLTSDSPAQVTDFYKRKLGSAATVVSLFGHTTMSVKLGARETLQVSTFSDSSLHNGKTVITITHMNHTAS
jgi:hypothetical protein